MRAPLSSSRGHLKVSSSMDFKTSSLRRSQTDELGLHRRDNIVRPLSRAMTTVPAPPRMPYCPRSSQDNFSSLSQLGNIIFSVAMGLAPRLTKFPGFHKGSNKEGTTEAVAVLEPEAKNYEEAFYAKRGERHTKPYAIAAILAAYVWDCIQEYRIFTEDAARDLRVLATLTDTPNVVHELHDEADEEVYAARMFYQHGAGKELESQTRAAAKVQKEMKTLYKHLFGKERDEEGKRLVEGELGKEVWKYAMELKNQKGRIDITFDPGNSASRYHTELYKNDALEISLFDEQPYIRARQPSIAEHPQDSAGRRSATGTPGAPPRILWFPEVTLYRRKLSDNEKETAVIFKAKYSRDLGRLIERSEHFLGSRRNSKDTSASRSIAGLPTAERSRTHSLRAKVASQNAHKAGSSASNSPKSQFDSLDKISPIPEATVYVGESFGSEPKSQTPPAPPKTKHSKQELTTINSRSLNSNKHRHIAQTVPARRLEQELPPTPTRPASASRDPEGGLFSKIMRLIMSLFKPRAKPTSYSESRSAPHSHPPHSSSGRNNSFPGSHQSSKRSGQPREKHVEHNRDRY